MLLILILCKKNSNWARNATETLEKCGEIFKLNVKHHTNIDESFDDINKFLLTLTSKNDIFYMKLWIGLMSEIFIFCVQKQTLN